jgi:hypothetical protein
MYQKNDTQYDVLEGLGESGVMPQTILPNGETTKFLYV